MTNQPELLEQFLQALRQNPHALPPDGLDPELSEFARSMMQQTPSPSLNARRRMWERALAQSRVMSNGHLKELNKMAVITARPDTLPRNNTRFPLTLLAAAFAALLFIAIYMMMPKGTPNFSVLGAPDNQQDSTATPIPSLVPPTSTPSPANPAGSLDLVVTGTPFSADFPTFVPTSTPLPYLTSSVMLSGFVYVPVVQQQAVESQVQRENTNHSVLSSELVYRVTLSDGSVVYVDAQPMEGNQAALTVEQLFPGVMVSAIDNTQLGGQSVYLVSLTNGVVLVVDVATNQILQFLPATGLQLGGPIVVSTIVGGGTIPSVGNPMQPTVPPPMDLQPSSVPNVIIVTATQIPAIVVTATFVPTAVP
jgi:hypothetical protein